MAGTILIGGLFVLVFMGFPIAIALGLVCCLYSNLFGTIDMSLIVESFLNGTNSFTLLAIRCLMNIYFIIRYEFISGREGE